MTGVRNTLDIKEQLTLADGEALRKIVLSVARRDAVFVEIGSWKGYSTSFLGQVAKDCGGHLYCVDHWKGNPGVKEHKDIENCFEIFRYNIRALGLNECVHPLIMSSIEAASIFGDGIADLVFIDADHHYEEVMGDIGLWMKKVKTGGILCGHDANCFYSKFPYKKVIDEYLNLEFFGIPIDNDGRELGIHPGVVRALYDYFSDKHTIIPGTTIWFVRNEKV